MELQTSAEIQCPHCGEILTISIDLSAGESEYIEDCHVCCRPILIHIEVSDLESEEFQVHASPG